MIREQLICFDLGYKVEDKTAFHGKLVDLFGVGGLVKRSIDGRVEDFDVLMEYGVLSLDTNKEVLLLNMNSSAFINHSILTSEDIQGLYNRLKEKSIIQSDKCWYLEKHDVYEV